MSVAAVQVTVILGHRAWYRKKATVGKTHDWILFVRGTDGNDISHFVEKIVYNLHESFSPSRRVRDKPPYELTESGYGEFYPMIDIYFKNKGEKGAQRKVSLQYFLNLNHKDAPPVNTSRFEKIKFHHPSEEFLEKVLKSGGVILDEAGIPTNVKPRLSSSNLHHGHESSKPHETVNADAEFGLKSLSHKDKKLKRSSEVNPMSNESVSSNDSLNSRLSSKSDSSEKEADALSQKRIFEAMLFDVSDEDVPKKKKKTSEKPDPGKARTTTSEPKAPGKLEANVEKKHRSSAEDGQRHSSGKSHRESGSAKHHEQHRSHSSSSGSGKQKGGGSSPRSASRTPQKTPTKNADKGPKPSESSRSHGGSSSHGGGGSSGHNNGSSSSSNSTGNPKSGASKGGSYHGDQFPKADLQHRGSSKQRDSDRKLDGMAKKLTSDVHVRLSPMDVKFSSPEMNSRLHRSPEAGGNKSVHSQDVVVSNGKSSSIQMSPLKYPPKTAAAQLSSPNNSSDGKGSDGVGQVTGTRNTTNFVAILKQLASEEDEEEDGEIRSPRVIETSDLGNWSKNGDKKSSKHRDGITSDRKKSSKSSSHPEKGSSETLRTSPKKQKSQNPSSDKMSVSAAADRSGSSSAHQQSAHGKSAKKLHARENLTSDASVPSRTSDSRPRERNDSSERKTEAPAKHRSQRVERVPSVEMPSGRDDDRDNLFADMLSDALYDKQTDAVLDKEDSPRVFSHPSRAPNGELLTSLVSMKQRLGDMMNCQLLGQIADVIEASGKFKVDDENFEFDLCALDAETVRKVKELMDSE